MAWLLSIASDLPPLALVAGDRDIAVPLGPCVRLATTIVPVVGLAFLANTARLGRVVAGSITSHDWASGNGLVGRGEELFRCRGDEMRTEL